jgi:pilus assembly protein CpaB
MALRNLLIALGVFALLAGIGVAALWFVRSPAVVETARPVAPSPSILVAARPIASGTLLRSQDLAWKDVPAGTVAPDNVLRSPTSETEFLGAVARRDFPAGDSLVASGLVKSSDRGFLAAALAPGKRAVSIAVDGPQSDGGLVQPGDRVDLILTQSFGLETANTEHKTVGEIVLTDLRVIAVDQWLSTVAKPVIDEKRLGAADSQLPRTVTLEVDDIQAERVQVAVQLGKIQLSVRALEGSGAEPAPPEPATAPVWAFDVSPALRMLALSHEVPAPVAALTEPAPTAAIAVAPPSAVEATSQKSRMPIEVMHGSKTEMH